MRKSHLVSFPFLVIDLDTQEYQFDSLKTTKKIKV